MEAATSVNDRNQALLIEALAQDNGLTNELEYYSQYARNARRVQVLKTMALRQMARIYSLREQVGEDVFAHCKRVVNTKITALPLFVNGQLETQKRLVIEMARAHIIATTLEGHSQPRRTAAQERLQVMALTQMARIDLLQKEVSEDVFAHCQDIAKKTLVTMPVFQETPSIVHTT